MGCYEAKRDLDCDRDNLVIGSLSTDYVKKRTAGSEETAAAVPEAASGFAGILSARERTDGEPLQE